MAIVVEPKDEDRYIFKQVHVCLDEQQSEFDQQNALLAKLVVILSKTSIAQSLNSKEPLQGGLNCLESFLNEAGFVESKQQLRPLRLIQNLRSTCSANTKGDNYTAALRRADLEELPLVEASGPIFQGIVNFLDWIQLKVLEIEDGGPPALSDS